LVEVLQDRVVLGNPRGIVQDEALHFMVERDPLGLIAFLPGLLQQLIHPGIVIERAIGRTGRVEERPEHTIRVGDICGPQEAKHGEGPLLQPRSEGPPIRSKVNLHLHPNIGQISLIGSQLCLGAFRLVV